MKGHLSWVLALAIAIGGLTVGCEEPVGVTPERQPDVAEPAREVEPVTPPPLPPEPVTPPPQEEPLTPEPAPQPEPVQPDELEPATP